MLQALLDDLAALPDVTVIVTRDVRLQPVNAPVKTITIQPGVSLYEVLRLGFCEADAVWPIVPETEGLLAMVSQRIESAGLGLLGCSPEAIRIASSKHATSVALAAAGIPAVPTFSDPHQISADVARLVIKPNDGAGCLETHLFSRHEALTWWRSCPAAKKYVAQPYIDGAPASLSLLCSEGDGTVLCCNLQHIACNGNALEFQGVTVNSHLIDRTAYFTLARRIAQTIPGLWGYVGVDLLETPEGPLVVDINPRLTTAYAGIKRALGMNIAEQILCLNKKPLPTKWPDGQEIEIRTHHE